jgi:hypothetical protein
MPHYDEEGRLRLAPYLNWLSHAWRIGAESVVVEGRVPEPPLADGPSLSDPVYFTSTAPFPIERCFYNGVDYFWNGDRVPRDATGNCRGCGQHYTAVHLGSCSLNTVRAGTAA